MRKTSKAQRPALIDKLRKLRQQAEAIKQSPGSYAEGSSKEHEEQANLKAIFEEANDGILAVNIKTQTFVFANFGICQITGYSLKELLKLSVPDIHPVQDLAYVIDCFGKQANGELGIARDIPVLRKDKKIVYCDVNSKSMRIAGGECLVGFFRDVTSRRRTEEKLQMAYDQLKKTQAQLIQAEKMEAVGRMASGVAHEVKNPLGVIMQGISYLEDICPHTRKDVMEVMEMIQRNAHRANDIVRALVDFSRKSALDRRPEDLGEIIDGSLNLVQHRLKLEDIKIIKKINKKLPMVLVNKGGMEQVLINIFLNAVQAMPEGGELFIRARTVTLNKPGEKVGSRSDDYFSVHEKAVVAEIVDNGVGINKEDLEKVFDPFFTTKDPGKGTGMGLSVTKNIIDMQKGMIAITSKPARGTRVAITLKIAQGG